MKKLKLIFILTIGLLLAVTIDLYPYFANIHNNKVNEQLIVEYEENISGISNDELEAEYAKAVAYNENLFATASKMQILPNEEEYESLLNLTNTEDGGIMAELIIPKIDLDLSVSHYTTEEVLQTFIGHVEVSSLPVGGINTHAILTGHRGLPSATLFSKLDELEIGDMFYIKVLGKTLAYQVAEIETVSPEELNDVVIEEGRDLVTLMTCTPYGVNTDRLLVTGERIEIEDQEAEEKIESEISDTNPFAPDYMLLYLAGGEVLAYFILLYFVIKKRGVNQNEEET